MAEPDQAPDWARAAGQGRYARRESERRFLLAGSPPPAIGERRIADRYLTGTRLRLRRMSSRDGSEVVWKLTQKVQADAQNPSDVALTTCYLNEEEAAVFASLPAATLSKVRRIHPHGGLLFAVDTFTGRHAGLRLAEVELSSWERGAGGELEPPAWLGREVTRDEQYTGGGLAKVDDAALAALITELG